jgi:hypothetical protein
MKTRRSSVFVAFFTRLSLSAPFFPFLRLIFISTVSPGRFSEMM